jgi:FolB domain-containing protein
MTSYFSQALTLDRLELAARLGCYAKERATRQPVEVTCRFYFPKLPDCASDDKSSFIDYDIVAEKLSQLAEKQEFRLIEYMTMQCYKEVRKIATKYGGKEVRVWLKLHKVAAPVPNLRGGTSFVYTDLPADAKILAVE